MDLMWHLTALAGVSALLFPTEQALAQEHPVAEASRPTVVWDVDFNSQDSGAVPRGFSKNELEIIDGGGGLPRRTYDGLAWLARTRWVAVEDSLGGLTDKPVVFVFEEDRPSVPHYGPQMVFRLPNDLVQQGNRFRLTLDLVKDNLAQAGGFTVGDVAQINFREEGWVLANKNQIGHFEPGVPIHFDLLIDTREKTVSITLNGDAEKSVTMPWSKPSGTFTGLRLDGYQPGGFARGRGRIAFDNIRLTMEDAQ